jgi:hypothetical protein
LCQCCMLGNTLRAGHSWNKCPSHHSLSEKKKADISGTLLFQGYYPTQTNFVPKSQLKERGIRGFTIGKSWLATREVIITF